MTKPIDLVKLSFCGPSDVMKEIDIAKDVVILSIQRTSYGSQKNRVRPTSFR